MIFACSDWLHTLCISFAIHLRAETKWIPRVLPNLSQNKITPWGWLFSCVVYTKTIIRLSVGEKRWIFGYYNLQYLFSSFPSSDRAAGPPAPVFHKEKNMYELQTIFLDSTFEDVISKTRHARNKSTRCCLKMMHAF